jgi:hypothetical protein
VLSSDKAPVEIRYIPDSSCVNDEQDMEMSHASNTANEQGLSLEMRHVVNNFGRNISA